MTFVNPQTLQRIFGSEGMFARAPDAPQGQQLYQMLAQAGAGMSQAAAQPGATFGQAIGGGAGGMAQGQHQFLQQQFMQAQQQHMQAQMEQAQKAAEREERRQQKFMELVFGRQETPSLYNEAAQQAPQSQGVTAQPLPLEGWRPGQVAQHYESSNGGIGTISSGRGDPGGVSYGPFQLSSNAGTMATFLQSPEGQPFAMQFGDFKPGSEQFNQIYREVAEGAGPEFEAAQRAFIERTHVQPVLEQAQQAGIPVDNPAVVEALYSQAVQHSGAGNLQIINEAVSRLPPNAGPGEVIDALYDARGRYARQFAGPNATTNRYARERRDVHNLLAMHQGPQQAPQQPQQQGGGGLNLPPEAQALMAILGPDRGAPILAQMMGIGGAQASTPARVREAEVIAQQTGRPVGEVLAEMRGLGEFGQRDGDQRDRRIADAQRHFGMTEAEATGYVDGLIQLDTNPVTGRVVMRDFRDINNPQVREVQVQPSQDAYQSQPPADRPTLWQVATQGNPTGVGSAVVAGAGGVLSQIPGVEFGGDTITQRQYLENAQRDLVNALRQNPRFSEGERRSLERDLAITASVWQDESALRARMRAIDTSIRNRLNNELAVADDPRMPDSERGAARSAAVRLENFLDLLGVPPDSGAGGGIEDLLQRYGQ